MAVAMQRSVEQSWKLWDEANEIIPMGTQTHSKAPREALRGVVLKGAIMGLMILNEDDAVDE